MDITTPHNISLLKTPMKYYASYETIFMFILISDIHVFTYFPIIRDKIFMSKNYNLGKILYSTHHPTKDQCPNNMRYSSHAFSFTMK
jgi:hypothetical protein